MPLQSNRLLLVSAIVGILLMGALGVWMGLLLYAPPPAAPAPEAAETMPASEPKKADLKADWSNDENPHTGPFGTWAFKQNHKPLTAVDNWEGLPAEQIRGWYPGVSTNEDFLIVCRADAPSSPQALGIVEIGDILMHTATAGREPGLITWTSPSSGYVSIHMSLWPTRRLDRTNTWRLRLLSRGTTKTLESGELPEDGAITRDKPATFKNAALPIQTGDVLELELKPGTGMFYGDFINMTMTITQGGPAETTPRTAPAAAQRPASAAPATPVTPSGSNTLIISFLVTSIILMGLISLGLVVVIILLLKRLRQRSTEVAT